MNVAVSHQIKVSLCLKDHNLKWYIQNWINLHIYLGYFDFKYTQTWWLNSYLISLRNYIAIIRSLHHFPCLLIILTYQVHLQAKFLYFVQLRCYIIILILQNQIYSM